MDAPTSINNFSQMWFCCNWESLCPVATTSYMLPYQSSMSCMVTDKEIKEATADSTKNWLCRTKARKQRLLPDKCWRLRKQNSHENNKAWGLLCVQSMKATHLSFQNELIKLSEYHGDENYDLPKVSKRYSHVPIAAVCFTWYLFHFSDRNSWIFNFSVKLYVDRLFPCTYSLSHELYFNDARINWR